MDSLISVFDGLVTDSLAPMTRAQYELQRHWLINPQENVAEALLMFACFPGMAGIPSPDGGLSFWLPLAHLVR